MRTRYRTTVLAALSLLVVVGVGCSTVKAKAAFKDGNKLYKEENYRKAIVEYEKAVALKPDFAEAHFYLASSHQSLFRPGKEGDENKMHLDKAVEHYEKSLETNKGDSPQLLQLRVNSLAALTAIYAEPPQQNFEKARESCQKALAAAPDSPRARMVQSLLQHAESELERLKAKEQTPAKEPAAAEAPKPAAAK